MSEFHFPRQNTLKTLVAENLSPCGSPVFFLPLIRRNSIQPHCLANSSRSKAYLIVVAICSWGTAYSWQWSGRLRDFRGCCKPVLCCPDSVGIDRHSLVGWLVEAILGATRLEPATGWQSSTRFEGHVWSTQTRPSTWENWSQLEETRRVWEWVVGQLGRPLGRALLGQADCLRGVEVRQLAVRGSGWLALAPSSPPQEQVTSWLGDSKSGRDISPERIIQAWVFVFRGEMATFADIFLASWLEFDWHTRPWWCPLKSSFNPFKSPHPRKYQFETILWLRSHINNRLKKLKLNSFSWLWSWPPPPSCPLIRPYCGAHHSSPTAISLVRA